MAITRIKNNQITTASGNALDGTGINAAAKVQSYTITSTKLANSLTYGSDLTVTGNLTVQGTTTSVNTTYTQIADPIITLADGQTTGTPVVDIGTLGLRGNQNSAFLGWKESSTTFIAALSNTLQSNTTVNVNSYANFIASTITANANLSVVGNIVGTANFSGNISAGNILTVGIMSSTGNATHGNVLTGGVISAAGNITANPSSFFIGNGSQLTGVAASSAGFPVSAGNSNIAAVSNGNIAVTVGGTANVAVFTTGGELVTGYVSATGNVTGGNVLTAGLISATSTITSAANITGANILTAGLVSATGNATAGNVLTAGIVSSTGNATAGNVLTAGLVSATGNATAGNVLTAGLISATGTITSAANIAGANILTVGLISATGNITGGNITVNIANITTANIGTLTVTGSENDTGNLTAGNVLTGGLISATGTITSSANITGANILTAGIVSATGNLTAGNISTAGNVATSSNVITPAVRSTSTMTIATGSGDLTLAPTGNVAMSSKNITGLADPFNNQDAATKAYVDNTAQGLDVKASCLVATVSNLATATGGTVTYNNGTAGVGATLTTTGTYNLIDGGNVQTVGSRILVKNEGNAAWNGIYTYTSTTVITRSADFDNEGTNGQIPGAFTFIEIGTVNDNTGWVCTTNNPVTMGTTAITFSQFSGAGTYTANTSAGISLTGTVFSALVDNNTTAFDGNGNIIVKAGANLTTPNIGAATGTSLSVTGSITANTNLSAVANVVGGNVLTAGIVSSTGNAIHGNILTAGLVSATANVIGGNILTGGYISAAGNITANPSSFFIGNGSQLTGVAASSAGFPVSAGNSNIAAVSNGNIAVTVGGTANVAVFTTGGELVTGFISANGNVTGGNVLTAGIISTSGNIYGANLIVSSIESVTGNITGGNLLTAGLVSATSNITGGNLLTAGLVSATSNITGGNVLTAGIVSSTGNAIHGNVLTGGYVSATGNIYTANTLTATGTTATGALAAIIGTANATGHGNAVITAGGNGNTSAQFAFQNANAQSNASADIAVYNNQGTDTTYFIDMGITSSGFDGTAYGANIYGANDGYLYVVGNSATGPSYSTANVGNLILGSTNGQVIVFVGNASTNNAITKTTTTGFSVTGAVSASGNANIGNAVFFVNTSTNTASFGNATQTTNAIVAFNAPTSVLMPVGNTAQRPSTGVTGMLRFNTTNNSFEVFNNSAWANVGAPTFTVIADESFSGDGSTANFTLTNSGQTTLSCLVSINGILQIPTTAYSVSGNTLAFTEAPAVGDAIDVREITTTTSVTSLSNGTGSITIDSSGNINVSGNIIPSGNGVANIGSSTNRFNYIYATATSAQYADLAEKYVADAAYEPGTVVSFGGTKEVTVSVATPDRAVAGVISTNPSYIMNGTLEAEFVATVAFTGRVPTKVTGPVRKGDLMVSNGDGTARADADPKVGTVIGKALEDFDGATGTIEVVVGRF